MYKLRDGGEITEEIKNAFKYNITKCYLEVVSDDENEDNIIIHQNNYLKDIKFDDCRYEDSEGIIGTTIAKELTGNFVNVDSSFDIENKEIKLYIGAVLDNELEDSEGKTDDEIINDENVVWLKLGTFIVQKPENDNVNDNTKFEALDYMVKFNIPYKDTITYPCTLGELLENICQQAGVSCGTTTFRNSTYEIQSNYFVSGETCRDVLKAISQMAFSWARVNEDDELVLDFDIIDTVTEELDYDEYYNLEFNNAYGPINTIILRNSQVEGENYTIHSDDFIEGTTKPIELVINDNYFAYTQSKRAALIEAGRAIMGLTYIPIKLKTIGAIYLNCQDKIRIKNMQDEFYESYIFNNTFDYKGVISDEKETSAMTETETKYQYTGDASLVKRTEIIVDKGNGQITSVVEELGDRTNKTSTITQDIDRIESKIENIADFTNEVRNTNELHLTETVEGNGYILKLVIKGSTTVFPYVVPTTTLTPSDSLVPNGQTYITLAIDKATRSDETSDIQKIVFEIGETLKNLNNVYDELVIENGVGKVIRRIGERENGSLYILETEVEQNLGSVAIPTFEEDTYIYVYDYYNAEMYCKYIIQSDFANVYATKVELSSSITQTSTSIMTEVNRKVNETDLGTKIEQNYESVKIAWNNISNYIQFSNAELQILDENENLLMSLNTTGQDFYKDNGEHILGEMGIQTVDNLNYIAFSIDADYDTETDEGMAWGIKTKSDNKFCPILYVKNFTIPPKNSGYPIGDLVLTSGRFVLESVQAQFVIGSISIYDSTGMGNSVGFTTSDGDILLNIDKGINVGSYVEYPSISMLDSISFYANAGGNNTFKIGTGTQYCLFTDEGYASVDDLYVGSNGISVASGGWITVNDGAVNVVHGNVYADNISSDRRIKENIKDSTINAIDTIMKFNHKEFDKITDGKHYNVGYIAQEMEKIDPNFVLKREKTKDLDEMYYINELPIIATISKAVQELQEEIEELQKKVGDK